MGNRLSPCSGFRRRTPRHCSDVYGHQWQRFHQRGESGVVFNAHLFFDRPVTESITGVHTYDLFGTTYRIWSISYSIHDDGAGNLALAATEYYAGDNSGAFHIDYPDLSALGTAEGTFLGLDPVMGEFGGTYAAATNLIFSRSRTAPSFCPSQQLWVNGALLSWQASLSHVLNANGDVSDGYLGTDVEGNTVTIAITGSLLGFTRTTDHLEPSVELSIRNSANELLSHATGSYVKGTPDFFTVPDWYIGVAHASRNSPYYLPNNRDLWVNGSRYAFQGGFDDEAGHHLDTYANAMLGSLSIYGPSAVYDVDADVVVSHHGENYSGGCAGGTFFIDGLDTRASAPSVAAYWVNGILYRHSLSDQFAYFTDDGQSLGVTLGDGIAQFSGADEFSTFTGSSAHVHGGIFLCLRTGGERAGEWLAACPANADGSLLLYETESLPNLPPAIAVAGDIWHFLGTAAENGNPEILAAYYGIASGSGPGSRFLKIRLADGTVTFTDCTAGTSSTGTYSLTTHLFQSDPGQLPVPMYGADPGNNNARWGWLTPADRRPTTVLVAGDVWGYTGTDADGADHYAGYYTGQHLTIAAAGRNSLGTVMLYDPLHPNTGDENGAWSGSFYHNGFAMASGTPAVTSGNKDGAAIAAGLSLATTVADLDVVGNLLSLGSLISPANTVGLTLAFSDTGSTARLESVLSRPQAEWVWSNASPDSFGSPGNIVAMMKLDPGNRLTLFDPAVPEKAAIVLNPDPAVGSRLNGPLRLPPAGDLDMGTFTNGPKPDGSN